MFLRSKEREFDRLLRETANAQDELPSLLDLFENTIKELKQKANDLHQRAARSNSPKDKNSLNATEMTLVADLIENAYELIDKNSESRNQQVIKCIDIAKRVLLSITQVTPKPMPVRAVADAIYRYISGSEVYSVGNDRGDKVRAVLKAVDAIDSYLKSLPSLEQYDKPLKQGSLPSLKRSNTG